ncbi:unnamed protein product [Cochlearia groenlandica]
MGGCASKPKESDIAEGSVPTTDNAVVESKDVSTETDTILTQEKKEESSEDAKKDSSSEATDKDEPTSEAVKADDEKAPEETETPKTTQETAPAKTDEAPLVLL